MQWGLLLLPAGLSGMHLNSSDCDRWHINARLPVGYSPGVFGVGALASFRVSICAVEFGSSTCCIVRLVPQTELRDAYDDLNEVKGWFWRFTSSAKEKEEIYRRQVRCHHALKWLQDDCLIALSVWCDWGEMHILMERFEVQY